MKKILFALSFFLFAGVAVNAQSSCCAKKTTANAKECASKKADTKVAAMYMEADKLAEADENIKKRVCSMSGAISYYQKSECATSGKITWDEVEYNNEEKAFTKVASAYMVKDLESAPAAAKAEKKAKACCSKADKAKCAKKAGA